MRRENREATLRYIENEQSVIAVLREVERDEETETVRAMFCVRHHRGIHARPGTRIFARLKKSASNARVGFTWNRRGAADASLTAPPAMPALRPVKGLTPLGFIQGLGGRPGDVLVMAAGGADAEKAVEIVRGVLEAPMGTVGSMFKEIVDVTLAGTSG